MNWLQSFLGGVRVPPLDTGNRSVAPGGAMLEEGNYQFIQPPMFPNEDIVMVPTIPVPFQNWGQYPLNVADPSQITGGGVNDAQASNIPSPPVFYYDEATGTYVDLTGG